jgi:hypothetical protein
MNPEYTPKQRANKNYYENNKEQILSNKKKSWYCENCKTEYRLSSKIKHLKTLSHRLKVDAFVSTSTTEPVRVSMMLAVLLANNAGIQIKEAPPVTQCEASTECLIDD